METKLQIITPDSFALLCFIVLMQNGDGLIDKSPDYVTEKAQLLLNSGVEAFGALDIHNMRKVKTWCDTWYVEMPSAPANYLEDSEKAAIELESKGFSF